MYIFIHTPQFEVVKNKDITDTMQIQHIGCKCTGSTDMITRDGNTSLGMIPQH